MSAKAKFPAAHLIVGVILALSVGAFLAGKVQHRDAELDQVRHQGTAQVVGEAYTAPDPYSIGEAVGQAAVAALPVPQAPVVVHHPQHAKPVVKHVPPKPPPVHWHITSGSDQHYSTGPRTYPNLSTPENVCRGTATECLNALGGIPNTIPSMMETPPALGVQP